MSTKAGQAQIASLQMFVAVATRRNFTRAALELGISEPAVSKQMKKLEQEIGAKLVDHGPMGVQLTSVGEVLKKHAEGVFVVLKKAHREMEEARGPQRDLLRVGHAPSHRDAALAAAAGAMEAIPDVRIVLEELVAPQLEDRLLDHYLDLGLRGYVNSVPSDDTRLRSEELGGSPFPLVVNDQHPLFKAGTKQVPLHSLITERFVLIRAKRHRQTLEDYFALEDFPPTIVAEASTVADVLSLVRARPELVTIVALPTPHLTDLRRLGRIQIVGAPVQKSFLLWPAPDARNKAAKTFEAALKACFRPPAV